MPPTSGFGSFAGMMHGRLLLLLFFLSGFCGLVYEVVWIRALSLTLSVTVYALVAVLCAFMGGMGLGAALAGSVADRLRRPLVAFGLVEIGIGLCGLVVPSILDNLAPAYILIHELTGGEPTLLILGRFLVAFAVLMLPATLMGTTLPLLSRAKIGSLGEVGRPAGFLYGTNTVGAVCGTIAAGFWLIPSFGLQLTSLSAACLNALIGVVAIAMGLRSQAMDIPTTEASTPKADSLDLHPWAAGIAVLVFATSGFTSMGYEVLWTRALEPYTHNSTYAYSAMLAMFLLGIGLGSLVAARFADRFVNPLLALGGVQVGIGVTVVLALFVYGGFETMVPKLATLLGGITTWNRVVFMIFVEATFTMLATTLLFGAGFPLIARIVVGSLSRVGRQIGFAYSANTIGSIFGASLVGFFILPSLGVRDTFVLMILINLAAGLLAVACALDGAKRFSSIAVIGIMMFAVPVAVAPDFFRAGFAARYGELLFYEEEITDTVMVTEAQTKQGSSRFIRYGDGRGTAGTWTVNEDRAYGHLPMLLHQDPRKILQITFGVGNSLSAVLQHPVDEVACVELSPGVIAAAPYFSETNRDALDDPRVTLEIEDGRNYLLRSTEKYDVIRLDPPELHTRGIVNLYTREFLTMARDHLADGGLFSIWVNAVMTPVDDLRKLVATMDDVFEEVSVWQVAGFSWILNGSMDPHHPDLARLQEVYSTPALAEELQGIGLPDPFAFLRLHLMTGEEASRFAGDAPLVTDDRTYVDFTVAQSRDSNFGIANINTDNWLIEFIEDGDRGEIARKAFFRKVGALSAFRQDVVPHVVGLEDVGLTRAELAAELVKKK